MWDHDGGNDFELIGSTEFTVQQLVNSIGSTPINQELKHPQKENKVRGNIKIYVTRVEE